MKVALVIPCYNEEKRMDPVKFYDPNLFYLFVNDGSKDNTLSVLKKMQSGNRKILNLEANVGKAEAVRRGMLAAGELYPEVDWIGYWDADLATPIDQVHFMLSFSVLDGKSYGGIFGSRVMRFGSSIKRNFVRHLGSRIFITYASFILGISAYDSQCGAKLFKRNLVSSIFQEPFISKWFFDMEIIQRMSLLNIAILECPLQIWCDVAGSKVNTLRDGLRGLIEILKIRKKYGKCSSPITEQARP